MWEDDNAQAYLGTVVPDFPNFFMLYGPNLQPGHGGSLIFVVEMQVRYIMDMLRKMAEQGLGAVEVRQDVHDRSTTRTWRPSTRTWCGPTPACRPTTATTAVAS